MFQGERGKVLQYILGMYVFQYFFSFCWNAYRDTSQNIAIVFPVFFLKPLIPAFISTCMTGLFGWKKWFAGYNAWQESLTKNSQQWTAGTTDSKNLLRQALTIWFSYFVLLYLGFFFCLTSLDALQDKPIILQDLVIRPFVLSVAGLLAAWALSWYRWQKRYEPKILNQERFGRYLVPLVGMGLTVLLWATFSGYLKPLAADFIRQSASAGFSTPPAFTRAALNPYLLPACTVGMVVLFFAAVAQPRDLWRAVVTSVSFVLLVAFAMYWTAIIYGMGYLIKTMPTTPVGM